VIARIATALVGIPIVLGACFSTNPLPFIFLVVVLGTLAAQEAWALLEPRAGTALEVVRRLLIVAIWVGLPLLALNLLHWAGQSSDSVLPAWRYNPPVLLALLPLWAGDTAAIFAGKAFGKHPLAPSISPKKTWEGAIANFLACIVAAWGTAVWVGIGPLWGLLIGVLAGVLGQLGDLFESWMKRKAGVKDSGRLLPGHGGVLDRIDSLLFSAIPTTVVYILASGR